MSTHAASPKGYSCVDARSDALRPVELQRLTEGNDPYGLAPKGAYRQKTVEVGSLSVANAFGLFDMHGNVWEWCEEGFHVNYEGAPNDGRAWLSGEDPARHTLRGGSWSEDGMHCRSAYRHWIASRALNDRGFRVVVEARTE